MSPGVSGKPFIMHIVFCSRIFVQMNLCVATYWKWLDLYFTFSVSMMSQNSEHIFNLQVKKKSTVKSFPNSSGK